MRLTLIFTILLMLNTSAKSWSQGNSFSISASNITLKELFNTIKSQSDYRFMYNNELVDENQKTSISVNEASIEEVLTRSLQELNLEYDIIDKKIIISPTLKNHSVLQQQNEVKGKVTDNEGEPLPGVTITIVGTTRGVITDVDGSYTIQADPSDKLVFSFIGMESQIIDVGAQRTINVVLEAKSEELDEVTVVAFGRQKKENVVASISSVKPSELKVPSSNLTTALAGKIAGIISYQRSGEPGQDNAEFFIRGVTTFGYKKDPLILIDGIESTSTDLARLQPDDVESFSIMKDATATALYGSRAANGVILINTKEGKEGKAKIAIRLENSISMPTTEVELADPITYMKLHTEAVTTRDPLGRIIYPQQKIDNTIAGVNKYMYPTTDWGQELIKDYTMNQRATLNVSGGGQVARYYVAGSFNKDNGLLKVAPQNNFNNNVDLKTYSLRSNVNVNLTNTTEMVVRLSGTFDDYSGPLQGGAAVYRDILRSNPVLFPPYYPKGDNYQYVNHVLFGNYDDGSGSYYLNPYANMVKGYKEYSRSTMSVQFEIKQDLKFITEGLSFRTMLNTNRYTYFDVTRAYNPFWYQAIRYDNETDSYDLSLLNEENGTEYLDYDPGTKNVESNFYFESALDYNRNIGEDHNVSGVLVFMAQNRLIGNANSLQTSLPFRNVGLAGRATHAYKGKYFTELNFGYNASERFYKKSRWGFFPSAGIGWTISNEPFWASIEPVISKLKIRATYGLSGNDAIGSESDRFLYLSEVNMTDASRSAVFGRDNGYSRNGISLSRYSDPNISWEKATKANLGLELTFLEDWEIAADVYKEVRSNILQTRAAIPLEMGLSATPKANVGKAEGQGIDLSLDYNKVFTNSLWIQGRANLTYATSKFMIYEENEYKNAPWKSRVGYPISQQWGYLAERLFIDDKEVANSPVQNFGEYAGGDIKYRDVNGDGQITELDQVPLGYPTTPEVVYGFGFSIGYKKFDFSTFFQGSGRSSFWIDPSATAPFINGQQLLKVYADDHWSEDNQKLDALWPRLSTTDVGNDNNSRRSTWFMRNGSFLRLKQIELGYSLPQSLLNRFYVKSLRVYASGTNAFVWSNFKLWDVEMGSNGLGYPIQRVFNLGVQVNF